MTFDVFFTDIISSPVTHLFPAWEIKLNVSIVDREGEGSGLMEPAAWTQADLAQMCLFNGEK